jgi:haloalkane dehalogenase
MAASEWSSEDGRATDFLRGPLGPDPGTHGRGIGCSARSFALEAALQAPQRVMSLVLHGLPVYTPEERCQRLANFAPAYVPDASGAHLAWIWARIRGEYPHLEPELATRFVADYLAAGPDFAQAYRAIFRHDLPARTSGHALPPSTLIGGTADRIGFMHPRACALLTNAHAVLPEGADDFVAERDPVVFAALVKRAMA